MADANTASRPESVVAHHVDGRVTKGQTDDFSPARPTFTLIPLDGADNREPIIVRVQDLKAVFFVKDFAGDPITQSGSTSRCPGFVYQSP